MISTKEFVIEALIIVAILVGCLAVILVPKRLPRVEKICVEGVSYIYFPYEKTLTIQVAPNNMPVACGP